MISRVEGYKVSDFFYYMDFVNTVEFYNKILVAFEHSNHPLFKMLHIKGFVIYAHA